MLFGEKKLSRAYLCKQKECQAHGGWYARIWLVERAPRKGRVSEPLAGICCQSTMLVRRQREETRWCDVTTGRLLNPFITPSWCNISSADHDRKHWQRFYQEWCVFYIKPIILSQQTKKCLLSSLMHIFNVLEAKTYFMCELFHASSDLLPLVKWNTYLYFNSAFL